MGASDESRLPVAQVYAALGSRPEGLSRSEVKERLRQFGRNRLPEEKSTPLFLKLLANFTHVMAILLWVGGVVAFLAQMPQLGIAIWAVNLINGAFSFWQEFKAEKATEALRKLLPTYALVLREGVQERVLSEELVPGDVVLLAQGDHISADARLVEEMELRVDQSTLTGESHPVHKTSDAVLRTDLSRVEMPNRVFAGTSVVAGTGKAVVFATGAHSEFGKIAHLTQSLVEQPSPLQLEMRRATRVISVLATGIGLLFFLLGIILAGIDLAVSFIFAMGMIVAFVPEGMLPTVTLSLAMGVQRMARRNALIKRLSVVETLGCATVICTDKTGTLTQNEMTVSGIWLPEGPVEVTGVGYSPEGELLEQQAPGIGCQVSGAGGDQTGIPHRSPNTRHLHRLLLAGGLCNNARLLPPDGESSHWTVLGDPTEAALKVLANKARLDLEAQERSMPRIRELPFDSRRKRMATIHKSDSCRVAFVKGAPKEVLTLCSRVQVGDSPHPLDDRMAARIMAANDQFARSGLRVLAVAERTLPAPDSDREARYDYTPESVERDLTFLGLVAMMDPPRLEVADAVGKCHRAGIRIIMITGDYGLTAESIARRIGIVRGARPRIVTGVELDRMDDQALQAVLEEEVIFARVAPEHKLRVTEALQGMGNIVAVTGDGVNDAPALKQADIGVAMGVTGTDVAKEAADMVLTDDNFASIVNAIEEGRAVYANIRKFAVYVFNSNMAEAVPFMVMLFSRGGIPLPLTIMQVLSIDLGTDMLPAVALGSEAPEAGVMDHPPRSRKEPLLNSNLLARALLWYGIIEAAAGMSAYFFLNWLYGWTGPGAPLAAEGTEVYRMATTMTLAGIVAAQVGAVVACRTERTSLFKVGLFTNRLVLVGVAVELILLGLLVYVPFLNGIFNTAPLEPVCWVFVFAWTPIIFLADEARKAILRRKDRIKEREPVPAQAPRSGPEPELVQRGVGR
jgi:potassium/sodium efflux P-type ATPase